MSRQDADPDVSNVRERIGIPAVDECTAGNRESPSVAEVPSHTGG